MTSNVSTGPEPGPARPDIAAEGLPALQRFALFEGLAPDVAEHLATLALWRRYAAEETVFDLGADPLEIHFVISGRIRLLSCIAAGEAVTLVDVRGGEMFGEVAAIDGLPRSARAQAVEESVVASVSGPGFVRFLEGQPHLAVRLLRRFAHIIRAMDARLLDMSSLEPTQRVMIELIRIAEPDPRVPGVWVIAFPPSYGELAALAGVDNETVARCIGELARDGVLRRRDGTITVLDWDRLQTLAKAKGGRNWGQRAQGEI